MECRRKNKAHRPIALNETPKCDLGEGLPNVDPGAAARLIKDFAKEHKNLIVKLVSISGRVLAPSEIDTVAKMPTYEQAVSMLMGLMKAPVQKLARTINEVPSKLVRTVAAIREQMQAAD